MNDVFNFRRFFQVFVNHTVAHYKMYLMSLAVLTGLIFLLMFTISYSNNFRVALEGRRMYFCVFLLLGNAIFTTGIFAYLGDKRKAIAYLMVPASNFEKFLVAWLYSLPIFFIAYTIGFSAIDNIIISMSGMPSKEIDPLFSAKGGFEMQYIILAFMLTHALSLFGALTFKNMHFIKSVFLLFVVGLLINLVNDYITHSLFPVGVENGNIFGSLTISEGNKMYYLPSQFHSERLLISIMSIVLWVGAYLKLKEVEV